MVETVKNGDFVELEYTGLLKDLDAVFDTTSEETAKKEGIHDPKMTYGPVSICVGEGQILQGLDASLDGLEIGKEHELVLPPEKAFGKKDGKLMKLVPTSAFKKQGITPAVGLQVNIDGAVGTIRTVTGGRTVVDFNHPFSGKDVLYRVKIRRKLTDIKEKLMALVELALNQKKDSISVEVKDGRSIIGVKKDFPDELLKMLEERIKKLLPEIKEVEFRTPGKGKDKSESKQESKPESEPESEPGKEPEDKKDDA